MGAGTSLAFWVNMNAISHAADKVRVSGESVNEAVSCQSLITHCAIINKEIVVDQAALCVYFIKTAHRGGNKGRKRED